MNLQNGSAITFLNLDPELPPRVFVHDSHRNMTISEEVSPEISRAGLIETVERILRDSGAFFKPSGKSLRIWLDGRLRAAMVAV